MSSVALLVGQCGNQIGHELMKVIDSSELHPLGHRDGKLRCVCVDSEPKVIHRNTQEDLRSAGLYRDGNAVIGQRGRGNNWALGYYGPPSDTEETSLLHRSMETLRKEVERCDCYAGRLLIHPSISLHFHFFIPFPPLVGLENEIVISQAQQQQQQQQQQQFICVKEDQNAQEECHRI